MNEILVKDIRYVKGVGEARAATLAKLGIRTIGDMLYFFPRSLDDRTLFKSISELKDGDSVCVRAVAYPPVQEMRIRPSLTIYSLVVRDGPYVAVASWFNNRFVKNAFVKGEAYDFYGRVSVKYGKRELVNPVYEKAGNRIHTGRVVPIYPLTAEIHQKTIQSVAKSCVDMAAGSLAEYLPDDLRREYNLCEINYAVSSIHFPATMLDYQCARRRFVFEELLLLQLGLFILRGQRTLLRGTPLAGESYVQEFISRLPFELTKAQKRAIDEIIADLSSDRPMSRLVQGDVGSGKTVVAFAAIYAAVKNGYQAALMAPTEILAQQHCRSAQELLPDVKVELLTGGMGRKAKKAALERLQSGESQLAIGTHALIEEGVAFKNLALVITDEQHRFGVRQRATLVSKGASPHVLVMSATPIPRTLALILYGDLDISVVNELPPGRQKVDTFVVGEDMRRRVYGFVKKQLEAGRQAYIVCPLVEESESSDLKAATELTEHLRHTVLCGYAVELLHGRMKPALKDEIMQRFADGKIHALVSTTVIEVGVNVPNANIIVVENAERFGLSQLHQLRGRVGRGRFKSYCVLLSGSGESASRLEIMAKTNDGFVVSQKDLELRGPGDFLGTRQHGLPNLRIADIGADMVILKEVQKAAREIIGHDPALQSPKYKPLKERMNAMFDGKIDASMIN